ncbi:MAG: VWA domain-containing protein [Oscillibacter sp.]
MFSDFFFLLRASGLKVSLDEWLTLMEGLRLGLHGSSLTGFYYLARAVLVKTEADFDRFDGIFLQYFKDIQSLDQLPPELLEWLSKPIPQKPYDKSEIDAKFGGMDFEEIMRQFEERMKEQHEVHNGGRHWVGTGGNSLFGHSGYNPNGIRIGGESQHHSAIQIASERNFRDYREDSVLDLRQFQVAFRRLRQFSTEDGPLDVLDLPETIEETSNNAGHLKLSFTRPRRNTVKVLLLFDSGGSMTEYSQLCSTLFQAANKSNQFKDLKAYFFHNCFYDYLFNDPSCSIHDRVSTEWVLRNLSSDYRVIVVGDAFMSPHELLRPNGSIDYFFHNRETGMDWIHKFVSRYKKMIWLNPLPQQEWDSRYYRTTISIIHEEVPMFHLSVKGLEAGLKKLMSAR